MEQNPNAMDVDAETGDNDNDNEGGYETDDTATTIDALNPGDYGNALLTAYYDAALTTPPPTNRYANANNDTHGTPPTRLLMNNQMPGQVYKRVTQQDGTLMLVPFTSDDYRSGEQPFDITNRAINRSELPYVQPRNLFGEEKEGGTSKSKSRRRKSKRRRAKKSLRKRKASRNKRRKTRSKK